MICTRRHHTTPKMFNSCHSPISPALTMLHTPSPNTTSSSALSAPPLIEIHSPDGDASAITLNYSFKSAHPGDASAAVCGDSPKTIRSQIFNHWLDEGRARLIEAEDEEEDPESFLNELSESASIFSASPEGHAPNRSLSIELLQQRQELNEEEEGQQSSQLQSYTPDCFVGSLSSSSLHSPSSEFNSRKRFRAHRAEQATSVCAERRPGIEEEGEAPALKRIKYSALEGQSRSISLADFSAILEMERNRSPQDQVLTTLEILQEINTNPFL
eukprot:TRINITY_DN2934_c0_g1_i1.p1 TRINITY_DN2934_c0_g1~~TRINITY_DN2934_c0_g1_i1.p1  ORF type:complete len:272 (-),score=40.72 TRINITY_DN2934_c0_g1_i1:45-860(-)